MNIDGQQVTTQLLARMSPTYSRDAIAEFEFVANRFDATQGRSLGAQLNVITKSGTNPMRGPPPGISVTAGSTRPTSSRREYCRIRTSS